jgi:flagellar motility protein MotE (MotC chaperone)
MRSVRLASLLFGILILTFTVRLGDLVVQIATGETPKIVKAEAIASEEAAKEEHGSDKKDDKDAKPERDEIPPKSGKKPEVKGLDDEGGFGASPYSDEEVKVLQSLSARREQLNKRERDIDQREKMLQAAEKKVDEKVAELNKLRQEIEGLLNKQTQMQEDRMIQLVRIYESMKPKDAANIFNEMQFDILLGIIDKMSERKVAPILAAMDPVKARDISARLSQQKALPTKAQ